MVVDDRRLTRRHHRMGGDELAVIGNVLLTVDDGDFDLVPMSRVGTE